MVAPRGRGVASSHYFRNPEAGGGIEYTGIGNYRLFRGQAGGGPRHLRLPAAAHRMDVLAGQQWIGEAGSVSECGWIYGSSPVGDTTWCKGRMMRKYEADGQKLVDLVIWADNQRGETTTKGVASVVLPVKGSIGAVVLDGSGVDPRLPQIG